MTYELKCKLLESKPIVELREEIKRIKDECDPFKDNIHTQILSKQ